MLFIQSFVSVSLQSNCTQDLNLSKYFGYLFLVLFCWALKLCQTLQIRVQNKRTDQKLSTKLISIVYQSLQSNEWYLFLSSRIAKCVWILMNSLPDCVTKNYIHIIGWMKKCAKTQPWIQWLHNVLIERLYRRKTKKYRNYIWKSIWDIL